MRLTIQFDPDTDKVKDTLDQVAKMYGTSLQAFLDEVAGHNSEPEPEPEPLRNPDPTEMARLQNLRPWNDSRAKSLVHLIGEDARRFLALLTVADFIPNQTMAAYLRLDSMRGVLTPFKAAAKRIRGIPELEKPYVRTNTSEYKGYSMNADRRALFYTTFHALEREDLLSDAEDFARQTGLI